MGKISERLKNKLRRRSPGKAEEMWMLVNSHKNWYHAVPAVTHEWRGQFINSGKICSDAVPQGTPKGRGPLVNTEKICCDGVP